MIRESAVEEALAAIVDCSLPFQDCSAVSSTTARFGRREVVGERVRLGRAFGTIHCPSALARLVTAMMMRDHERRWRIADWVMRALEETKLEAA